MTDHLPEEKIVDMHQVLRIAHNRVLQLHKQCTDIDTRYGLEDLREWLDAVMFLAGAKK